MGDDKDKEKTNQLSKQQKNDIQTITQTIDKKDQEYYCTLCSHNYRQSELLDNFKCPQCQNELFLIPLGSNKGTASLVKPPEIIKEKTLPPKKVPNKKSKNHARSHFLKKRFVKLKKVLFARSTKPSVSSKNKGRKKHSSAKSSNNKAAVRCPLCNKVCSTKVSKKDHILECPHCNFIGTVT